jgi:hypothetical protein
MRPPVALSIQPNQVVQPVRIVTATTGKVVDVRDLRGMAELAHTTGPFPHLPPPFRVHRVTLPTFA